jgi:2-oxoglutarate ferredoxin oxidoreductase subunit beta
MNKPVDRLGPKDFSSDQEIRWCPGCGDTAILKQVQITLPKIGVPKEDIVFISGIGCSSRFPYYLDTFGMHGIHGRAPAIATGLKASRPELSVWVITGDGDGLSIGLNHLMHVLRRNIDLNILLFKGQYSPTSEQSKVTKSTPYGSLDYPFNPAAVALGADASFFARTIDREAKQLQGILEAGHLHKGTSLIEIYQNCNIFNDGAFVSFTDRSERKEHALFLEDGEPLIFGQDEEMGIMLDGLQPKSVNWKAQGLSPDELWIHDKSDLMKAQILARFFDDPKNEGALPRPFGIFFETDRPCYEDLMLKQIEEVVTSERDADLDELIHGEATWDL